MICHHTGDRWRALYRVQTVLSRTAWTDDALLPKIVRVPQAPRQAIQKVRVERQDYVGLIEMVLRVDHLAKRLKRAIANVVPIHRLPLVPLRRWESLQKRL